MILDIRNYQHQS